MKDWRGQPVEVGDHVIYATRHGSSMTIVEGVVLEVKENAARLEVLRTTWGKWHTYRRPVWVGPSYLTVVTGLPAATDEPA